MEVVLYGIVALCYKIDFVCYSCWNFLRHGKDECLVLHVTGVERYLAVVEESLVNALQVVSDKAENFVWRSLFDQFAKGVMLVFWVFVWVLCLARKTSDIVNRRYSRCILELVGLVFARSECESGSSNGGKQEYIICFFHLLYVFRLLIAVSVSYINVYAVNIRTEVRVKHNVVCWQRHEEVSLARIRVFLHH